jgi:hypothetical protein
VKVRVGVTAWALAAGGRMIPVTPRAAAVPMVARIFIVTNRAQLTALVTRATAESTRVAAEPKSLAPAGCVLADVVMIMVRGAK